MLPQAYLHGCAAVICAAKNKFLTAGMNRHLPGVCSGLCPIFPKLPVLGFHILATLDVKQVSYDYDHNLMDSSMIGGWATAEVKSEDSRLNPSVSATASKVWLLFWVVQPRVKSLDITSAILG